VFFLSETIFQSLLALERDLAVLFASLPVSRLESANLSLLEMYISML